MCAFKRHFELLLYEYLGLLVGLIGDFSSYVLFNGLILIFIGHAYFHVLRLNTDMQRCFVFLLLA